jgi:hypothetical protein
MGLLLAPAIRVNIAVKRAVLFEEARKIMNLLLLSVALAANVSCAGGRGGDSAAHGTTDSVRAASAKFAQLSSEEKRFYRDMARASWNYLDAHYSPASGLVSATADWPNTTMWDIGAQLLGFYAAKELGILAPGEYKKRMSTTLASLEKMELYNNVAFHRLYSSKDASVNTAALGWTATDLGRFFAAMKILALREPEYAAQIERIVRRNDFKAMVRGGYLYGDEVDKSGKEKSFQEGRIGYEQYMATGFNQWGANAGNAASLGKNGRAVKVLGVDLLADRRNQDRILSEPFILQGIEFGFSPEMQQLAANVLKAQQARFDSTGQITMVSEDAVAVKPHYFYYYCVYCSSKPFVVNIANPGLELDAPRWVSTKAAFGWHALMPSDYTKKATDYVAPALDPQRGWASGVFEGTRESTKTFDVNTASVLMEIALYQLRGRKPLIEAAPLLPD